MLPCIAHYANGSFKRILLPSPDNKKEFLTEVKKKLRLRSTGRRQADLETFYAHGFTHITDSNDNTIFGDDRKDGNGKNVVELLRERERAKKTRQIEIQRRNLKRPRRFAFHRPISVALMRARHFAQPYLAA